MAEIKFYLDEHIGKSILKGLRARGIDAVSVVDIDMRTAADIDHLHKARELGRVIVSFDNDFLKLHAQGEPHAGIAFFQNSQTPIGKVIKSLELLYQVLEAKDMENHIEFF